MAQLTGDRLLLRFGGACAIVGGVLALVMNALHPRFSDFDDATVAELRTVAASGAWLPIHLGILLATLLILAGLYTFSRTIRNDAAMPFAKIGLGSAIVSGAVTLVGLGIDGYATKAAADAWAAAGSTTDSPEFATAAAVVHVGWGVFMLLVIAFIGVTPFFFGWAMARSDTYNHALGWIVAYLGLVAVLAGVLGILNGPSALVFILFLASSGLLTLWVIYFGYLLWQRSAAA